MHKKNLFRLIKLTVLMLAALLMIFPGSAMADNHGGDKDENGMHAGKHITVQDNGTYIVDLDAYATGKATFDTVTVPADIILVLDVSGSMDENMSDQSYEYKARESQAYSYNSYGNNTYYYKVGNNYYQVSRGNNNQGRRYLRYRPNNYSAWTYLTGTDTSTSVPSSAPTNNTGIIWTGVLYERTTVPAVKKMDALKTAVNTFIDEVAAKNKEAAVAGATNDELSRIAIIKFAGNNNNAIGDQRYNNNAYNYSQIVADLGVVTEANAQGTWKSKVNAFSPGGATRADYGMNHAKTIVNNHDEDHNYTDENANDYRSRVVVMFTDGLPTSGNTFEAAVANAAVSNAKGLKDKGVTVYSVAVHPDAHPEQDPGTQNFNQYLHAVSSNYPNATSYTNRGTRGTGNYYFAASSADELEKIFKEIGQSSGSTTTEVGSDAVMKDIVSSAFTLPEGADEDDISIKVVRWNSTTHKWGTGAGYEFTPEQWAAACTTYGATAAENVSVSISDDGKTVDVTGFDYSTHFKATSTEQDTDQYDVVGGVNKNTAKIVVSFEIEARPSAITGSSVATNGADSGIYVDGEAIINFDVPEVEFTPVTYVVDYVTSDTSTDTKASTIKLDYAGVLDNVQMLDDPSDDYLIGQDVLDPELKYTIYKGKYGTISFGDDAIDVQRRYVRYAPTTMNWDGYDRIFVKGASSTESDLDVWAMLCVIPANSVFYEDTYITQTKEVDYNGQKVTIEYTGIGYDKNWSTVGTEGKNQTQHANKDAAGNPIPMGWIDGLADDSTYANDMAHTANTSKAKATFTFSGTGVDIYSRTNGSTGTCTINVKSADKDNTSGKKVNKTKMIDTKAAAGDFFAIPVCTFTDLPYGKYTTTITVTSGGQKEGRMTFYLDGVRVYNPIQPLEGEENIQKMYGEKNLGAVFTEVRSMLADGDATAATALYLDEYTTSETVTDVKAIEAAAKALSEAQQARDAYVESDITPAKNAITTEEYALSSAKDAVTNAQNVYDAAAASGATQAELDDLQEKIDAAKDALTEAQNHYDSVMPGLQADLQAANDGKATYDNAVNAAIENYDTVNNGVIVGYSQATLADYEKEGPKSEVYLDKNQQIAINVESGKYYYIGLKSFKGDEVTAQINGEEVKLSHSTDLYYEATPKSGNVITIKNAGDAILSITKLRTTGEGNTTSGTKSVPVEETLAYVRGLADQEVTSFSDEVLTEEEAGAAAVEEVEETAAAETEEIVLDESDIEIENAAVESEPETTEEAPAAPAAASDWSKLLSSFFGFFRR